MSRFVVAPEPKAPDRLVAAGRFGVQGAAVFVHYPTIYKILRASLRPEHFSLRRTGYNTVLFALQQALFGAVRTGELVDDIAHPAYKDQAVPAPVFVVAVMRSGTTYLHHLLSLDEERFTYFKLYQTLLPSVSADRLVDRVVELDRRHHLGLGRLVEAIDRQIFPTWEQLHPVGLAAPEEDEGLFVFPLLTPSVYLLFPFIDELPEIAYPDDMPRDVRDRLAGHYRAAVQRHLYAEGTEKIPLVKNVLAAGRLGVIEQAFPDVRFIQLSRHPYEVLPAIMSMYHKVWARHSPDIAKDSPEMRALARLWMGYYRRLIEHRKQVPKERFLSIRYEDLMSEPIAVVERIYDRFGFELTPAYRGRLLEATRKAKSFKSQHSYSLEEYGLSAEIIDRELGDLMDELGYTRGASGCVAPGRRAAGGR